MKAAFNLLRDLSVVRGAALILVAAGLIGGLHNAASPLGVRFESPAASTAPHGGSPYSNDTVSIEVLPRPSPATAPRNQPAESGWKLDGVKLAWLEPFKPSPVVEQAPARRKALNVTWTQAEQLVRNSQAVLVDARTEDAFRAGRIPGAVNLPFVQLASRIDAFKANYPDTRLLILYCADVQCPVSHSLADALLNQHGYVNVRVLSGGYLEWRKASATTRTTP